MSERARPWWASDGPVDGGIAPDEDPVERVRAARRGGAGTAPGPEEVAEPWLDAVAATMSSLARTAARPGGAAPTRDEAETSGAEGPHGTGGDPATEAVDGAGEGPWHHQPDVCGVCPICVGLRALAESRPELVSHLAEAARQVALAARSLRERAADAPDGDARGRDGRGGDGRRGDGDPLEHIDLE